MSRENIVRKWLDIAEQDLQVAELNHNHGYWLYAAFLCHQALEKALKAYWVAKHDDDPPFTHSHTRLLNGCELIDSLSDEQLRFITLIEPMYIEARYPEQKLDAAKMLNKEASQYILDKAKELIQWIEKKL
ncbi:MAG: HEPN domain-containing protein [Prevotella sp.]|jgi:HEPN domain-containing protein|nr:HEPN domain-containing protein [Prevotella sp.]